MTPSDGPWLQAYTTHCRPTSSPLQCHQSPAPAPECYSCHDPFAAHLSPATFYHLLQDLPAASLQAPQCSHHVAANPFHKEAAITVSTRQARLQWLRGEPSSFPGPESKFLTQHVHSIFAGTPSHCWLADVALGNEGARATVLGRVERHLWAASVFYPLFLFETLSPEAPFSQGPLPASTSASQQVRPGTCPLPGTCPWRGVPLHEH